MRLHRFAASLLLGVLVSPVVRSASGQAIAGRVIDRASRLPTRLLAVRVLGDSGRIVVETRTDTAGIFTAILPAGGAYRLRFALDSATTFESDTIRVQDNDYVERQFVVSLPRAYFEFEVEKPVSTKPNSGAPQYPPSMKTANIEGEVLVQFVVDTTGLAILETFRVLRSSDPAFTRAVRAWLPGARYQPAELKGRPVRQVVQQPFTFALTGTPARSREPDWPPPPPVQLPPRPRP